MYRPKCVDHFHLVNASSSRRYIIRIARAHIKKRDVAHTRIKTTLPDI